MQAIKANRTTSQSPSLNRYVLFGIFLLVLALIGVYAFKAYSAYRARFLPASTLVISQNTLEEKYGLRIDLLAVTAAGGMLDVRMKILDGEKAKALLQDSKNYPALFIDGRTLNVPDDTKSQTPNLETGANFFLLFPNVSNLVRSGDPVTIVFGNTAIEPIPAR